MSKSHIERITCPHCGAKGDYECWDSVDDSSVCKGCIYAAGISEKADGCGQLSSKSFRERVIKGYCEHRKTNLFSPSVFEENERREQEAALQKAEKESDVYALKVVQGFIDKCLEGNIDNLKTCDFYNLHTFHQEDEKWRDELNQKAMKAILVLAFEDVWPELTYDSLEHHLFSIESVSMYQRLFDSYMVGLYFKGMEKFNPSKELFERAKHYVSLYSSIGNFFVFSSKGGTLEMVRADNAKWRDNMDQLLLSLYKAIATPKKEITSLVSIMYKGRKQIGGYGSIEGFPRMIHNLLLDDFMGEDGTPKSIFKIVGSCDPGLTSQDTLRLSMSFFASTRWLFPKEVRFLLPN